MKIAHDQSQIVRLPDEEPLQIEAVIAPCRTSPASASSSTAMR